MSGNEVARIGRGESGYPERIVRALGDDAPPFMSVIGNADLLRGPLLALFCSVRCPGNLILGAYDAAVALREAGVPVVAGFHSPMEQECLRLLLRGTQPVVVAPARDITRMRVPAEWREQIERGRLAVVSWFGERERRVTMEQAQTRNRAVAALAEAVLVVHAAAGGKTETLCREIAGWGRPLYALDDAQNAGVMALGARAVGASGGRERWARGMWRGCGGRWGRDTLWAAEIWFAVEGRTKMMRQPEEYFERDEDGIRLKGHRIWLEDLLAIYLDGMTPEQIAAEYYTVSLEEARAAVAYYETHRTEVDAYMEQQRREAEEREREADADDSARTLRAAIERLEALRMQIVTSGDPLVNWDEVSAEVAERRGERYTDAEA